MSTAPGHWAPAMADRDFKTHVQQWQGACNREQALGQALADLRSMAASDAGEYRNDVQERYNRAREERLQMEADLEVAALYVSTPARMKYKVCDGNVVRSTPLRRSPVLIPVHIILVLLAIGVSGAVIGYSPARDIGILLGIFMTIFTFFAAAMFLERFLERGMPDPRRRVLARNVPGRWTRVPRPSTDLIAWAELKDRISRAEAAIERLSDLPIDTEGRAADLRVMLTRWRKERNDRARSLDRAAADFLYTKV